jgi:hypothetical protein
VFDDYGPGTHSWPYWARDLRWSIGQVMADFAHPQPTPNPISYTSDLASYSVFGWRVAIKRTATEFSTLAGAGRLAFTLRGSGSATVTTPPWYARHALYEITTARTGETTTTLERTGRRRRLTIAVPLGPPNPQQEYTLAAGLSGGTTVYSTHVTISRVIP